MAKRTAFFQAMYVSFRQTVIRRTGCADQAQTSIKLSAAAWRALGSPERVSIDRDESDRLVVRACATGGSSAKKNSAFGIGRERSEYLSLPSDGRYAVSSSDGILVVSNEELSDVYDHVRRVVGIEERYGSVSVLISPALLNEIGNPDLIKIEQHGTTVLLIPSADPHDGYPVRGYSVTVGVCHRRSHRKITTPFSLPIGEYAAESTDVGIVFRV